MHFLLLFAWLCPACLWLGFATGFSIAPIDLKHIARRQALSDYNTLNVVDCTIEGDTQCRHFTGQMEGAKFSIFNFTLDAPGFLTGNFSGPFGSHLTVFDPLTPEKSTASTPPLRSVRDNHKIESCLPAGKYAVEIKALSWSRWKFEIYLGISSVCPGQQKQPPSAVAPPAKPANNSSSGGQLIFGEWPDDVDDDAIDVVNVDENIPPEPEENGQGQLMIAPTLSSSPEENGLGQSIIAPTPSSSLKMAGGTGTPVSVRPFTPVTPPSLRPIDDEIVMGSDFVPTATANTGTMDVTPKNNSNVPTIGPTQPAPQRLAVPTETAGIVPIVETTPAPGPGPATVTVSEANRVTVKYFAPVRPEEVFTGDHQATAIIIAVSVGVGLLFVVSVSIFCFYSRRRRRHEKRELELARAQTEGGLSRRSTAQSLPKQLPFSRSNSHHSAGMYSPSRSNVNMVAGSEDDVYRRRTSDVQGGGMRVVYIPEEQAEARPYEVMVVYGSPPPPHRRTSKAYMIPAGHENRRTSDASVEPQQSVRPLGGAQIINPENLHWDENLGAYIVIDNPPLRKGSHASNSSGGSVTSTDASQNLGQRRSSVRFAGDRGQRYVEEEVGEEVVSMPPSAMKSNNRRPQPLHTRVVGSGGDVASTSQASLGKTSTQTSVSTEEGEVVVEERETEFYKEEMKKTKGKEAMFGARTSSVNPPRAMHSRPRF